MFLQSNIVYGSVGNNLLHKLVQGNVDCRFQLQWAYYCTLSVFHTVHFILMYSIDLQYNRFSDIVMAMEI